MFIYLFYYFWAPKVFLVLLLLFRYWIIIIFTFIFKELLICIYLLYIYLL
jgi:hypothetical protein